MRKYSYQINKTERIKFNVENGMVKIWHEKRQLPNGNWWKHQQVAIVHYKSVLWEKVEQLKP